MAKTQPLEMRLILTKKHFLIFAFPFRWTASCRVEEERSDWKTTGPCNREFWPIYRCSAALQSKTVLLHFLNIYSKNIQNITTVTFSAKATVGLWKWNSRHTATILYVWDPLHVAYINASLTDMWHKIINTHSLTPNYCSWMINCCHTAMLTDNCVVVSQRQCRTRHLVQQVFKIQIICILVSTGPWKHTATASTGITKFVYNHQRPAILPLHAGCSQLSPGLYL